MVIQPKVRGFLCTTTHPTGCFENVRRQAEHVRSKGDIADGPKRVLVLGASTGYGLASRITAAFGSGASTIGVFFEKPGTDRKPGTAGWYNSAGFHQLADELYQPAVPGLRSVPGFSKKTPIVAAPEPNAAVMREARPYPVDAPSTSTRLGPSAISPLFRTCSAWRRTFSKQPVGWVVVHKKPRTLG